MNKIYFLLVLSFKFEPRVSKSRFLWLAAFDKRVIIVKASFDTNVIKVAGATFSLFL